ncbi:MAG: hypothetical protein K0S79_607 [Nitrospira sp.]|nr:hypothetical protein [Nitrospira sp.]
MATQVTINDPCEGERVIRSEDGVYDRTGRA